MDWLKDVNTWLPLLGTLVAIVAWFIKLEFNVNDNHRRIKELEKCRTDNDVEYRSMRESIVRLETMMNSIIESIAKIEKSIEDINKKIYDQQTKRGR